MPQICVLSSFISAKRIFSFQMLMRMGRKIKCKFNKEPLSFVVPSFKGTKNIFPHRNLFRPNKPFSHKHNTDVTILHKELFIWQPVTIAQFLTTAEPQGKMLLSGRNSNKTKLSSLEVLRNNFRCQTRSTMRESVNSLIAWHRWFVVRNWSFWFVYLAAHSSRFAMPQTTSRSEAQPAVATSLNNKYASSA